MRLLRKFLGSFDNYNTHSFSARKLSAFVLIATLVGTQIWVCWQNKPTHDTLIWMWGLDLAGALLLLGVITAEHLTKAWLERKG